MKKIVCCAAVVFGMMEVSQGMEIECKNENEIGGKMEVFDWKNKSKDEIRQKIKDMWKKVDVEKLVIPCNQNIKWFFLKDGKFCNEKGEIENLQFCGEYKSGY